MCEMQRLIKNSWEAETSIENREAVDLLVIRLEETSEGENNSDDWQVPLG
jgi:hypothetical protein